MWSIHSWQVDTGECRWPPEFDRLSNRTLTSVMIISRAKKEDLIFPPSVSSCFLVQVSASVFRVVCLQVCRPFLLSSRYMSVFRSAVNFFLLGTCLSSGLPSVSSSFSVHVCLQVCRQLLLPYRYMSVFRSAVNFFFLLGTCLSSGLPSTSSSLPVHVCLQPCRQFLLPSRYLSVFKSAVNCLCSRYLSVFRPR